MIGELLMKRVKLIALTLLALFALGAVMASAASAEEGFLPLNKKGLQVLSKEVVFETHSKTRLQCTSSTATGNFKNDSEGSGTITFEGCKTQGLSAKSLTATVAGQIKAPVTYQICLINSEKLTFGVAITPTETIHVENTTILLEVKGTVIGEILAKAGEKLELFVVDFGGKEGLGNVTACKKGTTTITSSFLARLDPGEFEEASERVEKGLMQFEEKVELMDT
jgi:hypothetical protein